MSKSHSTTTSPSEGASVTIATADEWASDLNIPQTSSSETPESWWKQRGDLQAPTGPSLILSDPSIPATTYASCSKGTTNSLNLVPELTPSGPSNKVYDSTLAMPSPKIGLNKQVQGTHYRKYKIQPVEYIVANGVPFLAANGIKYLSRYKDKGGADDIRKAIHYCELILEFEYGQNP